MIERPMYADKIILQMILPAATMRKSKQCTLRIFFYRVSTEACGKHLTTHHRKSISQHRAKTIYWILHVSCLHISSLAQKIT